MSLWRTVYLGAIFCGWMAFAGWFAAEVIRQGVSQAALPSSGSESDESGENAPVFLGSESLGKLFGNERNLTITGFLLVGAAIGAGLGLAGGLSNPQPGAQVLRMLRGLVAGSLGGAAGGWLGDQLLEWFSDNKPFWVWPVGWMAAGTLIGLVDGLFTLSPNRIRNGLIGGIFGGLIGGVLFVVSTSLLMAGSAVADPAAPRLEMTGRATGFVAVGLCLGAAVGLTHLLLKHAWLTVLDGDRPGRQVILTSSGLTLGSDPVAGLPFLGEGDRILFPTHLRIERGRDGSFSLVQATPAADAEVTLTKDGKRLRYSFKDDKVKSIVLENESVINCGRNAILFNEKSHKGGAAGPTTLVATSTHQAVIPAPPPQPPPPPPRPARSTSPGLARTIPRWKRLRRHLGFSLNRRPNRNRNHRRSPSPRRRALGPRSLLSRSNGRPLSRNPSPDHRRNRRRRHRTGRRPRPRRSRRQSRSRSRRRLRLRRRRNRPRGRRNVCPHGHQVPAGQRYCIICDMEF